MSVSGTAPAVGWAPSWAPRRLLSDARLARHACDGDRRAFEAIFERYHQELYRYCRAIVRDPDEAQDALQGTMASALRSLPGDRRQIALRPWLYRVAHNESVSILRQRSGPPALDQPSDPVAPAADSEAEARERLRELVADLDQLPERQRGALVMRELSGLSYAEISAALAVTEAAARQAVYEARLGLRELDRGREMECEAARRALSGRDGRLRRNRRLRAHLRACEACRGFQAAISQRRSDLRALCPPLPAVAASGLSNGLLGGTGTGGVGPLTMGLAGGAEAGAGTAGPLAVKAASIAAAVAIGAGAADMSGVELPAIDHRDAPTTHPAMAGPFPSEGDARMTARAPHETLLHASRARAPTPPRLAARSRGRPGGRGEPSRRLDPGSPDRGEAPAAPAGATPPAISNGNPPAHASARGNPPAHASAGGNPPAHASAGGGARGHGRPSSSPGSGNLTSNASNPPGRARGAADSPPERGGPAPARGSAGGRGPSGAPSPPAGHESPAARGRSSNSRPR